MLLLQVQVFKAVFDPVLADRVDQVTPTTVFRFISMKRDIHKRTFGARGFKAGGRWTPTCPNVHF